MKRLLVLGAGTAGTMVVNKLRHRRIGGSTVDIDQTATRVLNRRLRRAAGQLHDTRATDRLA
jgi:NADH dehydrogenase FAD-containing subunit